ncbi:unnamed protein product [Owenia fusiformis]|uniref:Uncharacterized protein n=1 Tax=Owenia fusiformis TaxID=6347 RepID=A0A8J1TXR3_OWEFU|nr:unnamed protein product [Owenia fusiformis]
MRHVFSVDTNDIPVNDTIQCKGIISEVYTSKMSHASNIEIRNLTTEELYSSIEKLAKDYQTYKIGEAINCYLLPMIIPLGLVGNILSLMVMVQLHNRRVKMCRYLAIMAITDTITLLIGVFYWTVTCIQSRNVSSLECKLEVYFLHLGTTYSVFVIVAMTCDRFTAIKAPFKRYMCMKECKLRVILTGGFLFLVVYNLPHLWTTSVMANGIFCEGASTVDTVSRVFSWANICLAVLFPFFVLLALNVTIILEVRKSRRFFQCFGAVNIGSTGSLYSRHSQRQVHIEQGINLQRYKRTKCNKPNDCPTKERYEMQRIVESDDEGNIDINLGDQKGVLELNMTEHINHLKENEVTTDITRGCIKGNKEINIISDINRPDSSNGHVDLQNHTLEFNELQPNLQSLDTDRNGLKEKCLDSKDDLLYLQRKTSKMPRTPRYTREKNHNYKVSGHIPKSLGEFTNGQENKHHATPLLLESTNKTEKGKETCPKIITEHEPPDSPIQLFSNHVSPPPSPSTSLPNHHTHGADHGHRNRDAQLTFMLLAVTFTFLVLSLPQYLRYIIYAILDKHASPEVYATYMLIYHITNKLFFTNASVNFYLYCLSGSRFRNDIRNIFSRRKACYVSCRSSVISNSGK